MVLTEQQMYPERLGSMSTILPKSAAEILSLEYLHTGLPINWFDYRNLELRPQLWCRITVVRLIFGMDLLGIDVSSLEELAGEQETSKLRHRGLLSM